MELIQIALVDDHRLFRSGIASLIDDLPGYSVHFEAGNGRELIAELSAGKQPDIILLDYTMPVMNGAETAAWLRVHHPEIAVITLSMFGDAEKVLQMLKLGVKGYLLKDAEPYEFKQALLKVSQGEVYYPDFVMQHLTENAGRPASAVKMNNRELEFLKLAATEMTYKEIADSMFVSVRTVDSYRDSLFEKLQIKNRIGLALYAIKNKLIEL